MLTLVPESERRVELLRDRFTRLTANNPEFQYSQHLRRMHPDGGAVATALLSASPASVAHIVADDSVFRQWRLRLEHPCWWIGLRVHATTAPLAELVADLEGTDGPRMVMGRLGSGGVGSHWNKQAQIAVAPLSQMARADLAVALRRELVGRLICQSGDGVSARDADYGAMFPEDDFYTQPDADRLRAAIARAAEIHGGQWATAIGTMIAELDPITWGQSAHALEVDATSREKR